MEQTSEFGKGFVYNLILFAAHFERRYHRYDGKEEDFGLWFNGASDHLYELEIPEKWKNTETGVKAKQLRDVALEIGHGRRMMEPCTEKEYEEVVVLTKEIGLLIDKEIGVSPIKGDFE